MTSFKKTLLFGICAVLIWSELALAQDKPLFILNHPLPPGAQGTSILTVKLSPDGTKLLAAGYGVKLWDLNTGQELLFITGFGNYVQSAAFSWDGKYIVTGDWLRKIKVFDSQSGKLIQEFQDPETHDPTGDFVFGVAFSPDGKWVLSSQWHKLDLWDVATGQLIKRLPDINNIASRDLFFLANGVRVVAWSDVVYVLNLNSGDVLNHAHSWISSITPDLQQVITYQDGLKVWELLTGKNLYSSDIVLEGNSPVVFPDDQGYKLAYTTYEGNVAVDRIGINPTLSRSQIKTFTKEMDKPFYHVLFSPDGKKIIMANADTVYIYDSSVLTSAIKGAEGYE